MSRAPSTNSLAKRQNEKSKFIFQIRNFPFEINYNCFNKFKVQAIEEHQDPVTMSEIYTLAILLIINLVNFADRYTLPSVVVDIDKEFSVNDEKKLALVQTAFIIAYMIFSPLFGYLGDRFNRRILMAIGLFVWAASSMASAYVTPSWGSGDSPFWIFLTLRALVGVGEASYVTISPTIISDLFVGKRRTVILLIYQSLMLIGSGVGYMTASKVRGFFSDIQKSGTSTLSYEPWHYAFMVWPPVVFLCMVGLIFMKDAERGKAEGVSDIESTPYCEDLHYLAKM